MFINLYHACMFYVIRIIFLDHLRKLVLTSTIVSNSLNIICQYTVVRIKDGGHTTCTVYIYEMYIGDCMHTDT